MATPNQSFLLHHPRADTFCFNHCSFLLRPVTGIATTIHVDSTAPTTILFNLSRVLPGVARRGTGCSFSCCRLQQKIACRSSPSTRRSLAVIAIAGSSLKLFSWSLEAFFVPASSFSMRVEAFLSCLLKLFSPSVGTYTRPVDAFFHVRLHQFPAVAVADP